MLKELTKIANKLDGLGHTKEADLLDKVIYKMAAMGEGAPAYMFGGPQDFDLEVTEEGEMQYPEGKTIMRSEYKPMRATFNENEGDLISVAKDFYFLMNRAINAVWKLRPRGKDGLVDLSENIFDLENKIKKIKNSLIKNYANDLDSREDIAESIDSLLQIIKDDRAEKWSTPYSLEWAFFGEEEYHLLNWLKSYIGPYGISISPQEDFEEIKELKKYFDRGCEAINRSKETFAELKSESAYQNMDEIVAIIAPAEEFVYNAANIISSVKPEIDRKFKLLEHLFAKKALETTPGYEMPPEQAVFEQSHIPFGDADIGDTEELKYYTGQGPEEEDEPEEEEKEEEEEEEWEWEPPKEEEVVPEVRGWRR